MRKTKIVCTIGPASDNPETLKKLMLAGMNVGRINFSHGNYQDQEERINTFKKVRDELGLPIPLLLDTQGPEIRIGKFENGEIYLNEGALFTLVDEDIMGDNTKVSVSYKGLYKDVSVGTTVLINDGTIELKVIEIKDGDIICTVIHGGKLTDRKSVNVPNLILHLPSITEKDVEDIKYGIKVGFDYIAASFVRKPEDINAIREVLKENGGEHIKIIAKIENREGIDNFDKILEVSDGIMVARGDLGVEIPMEQVPIYQKQFIKKCYKTGKPVITATQMLESMIQNPRPTRAEVSDIANAIYDGTSCIMLSGETATGSYPVECVETMNKVSIAIEESLKYWKRFKNREYALDNLDYKFNMNYSVCTLAANVDAKAIVAYTNTGDTTRMLSSFGPECPIFAITSNEVTYRQLGLCWNIIPKLIKDEENIDALIKKAVEALKEEGFIQKGDKIVVAGGSKIAPNFEVEQDGINDVIGGIIRI
ncbi:MAG: pyruvate kinase [Clostridia bacterium]|nr:pyruvate kinase [Clostridia bacterium]